MRFILQVRATSLKQMKSPKKPTKTLHPCQVANGKRSAYIKRAKACDFFSFYSQTAKVNLIVFRQKVSVKGFNLKTMQNRYMTSIMKVFYSLHCFTRVEDELSPIPLGDTSGRKALTFVLYCSSVEFVGCTKINIWDF